MSLSALSIRLRIALLIIAPILGLCAVGGASWFGASQVARAFEAFDTSRASAEQASNLAIALAEMRRYERDFRLSPDAASAAAFRKSLQAARGLVDQLKASGASADQLVDGLKRTAGLFEEAFEIRKSLGLRDAPGLEIEMDNAAQAIDKKIDRTTTMGAGDGGTGELRKILQAMRDTEHAFSRTHEMERVEEFKARLVDYADQLKAMVI